MIIAAQIILLIGAAIAMQGMFHRLMTRQEQARRLAPLKRR